MSANLKKSDNESTSAGSIFSPEKITHSTSMKERPFRMSCQSSYANPERNAFPVIKRRRRIRIRPEAGSACHEERTVKRLSSNIERPPNLTAYSHSSKPGRMEALTIDIDLPCGWHVRLLSSRNALRREGHQMRHCIGGYFDSVMEGELEVYSFHSGDGKERMTLTVKPPFGSGGLIDCDDKAMHREGDFRSHRPAKLNFAGPRNQPCSAQAFRAVGELLSHIESLGVTVRVDGL